MQCYNKKGKKIKVYNEDGGEISVMPTIQATHESAEEYRRAERYKKAIIIENIAISIMLITGIHIGIRGNTWKKRHQ